MRHSVRPGRNDNKAKGGVVIAWVSNTDFKVTLRRENFRATISITSSPCMFHVLACYVTSEPKKIRSRLGGEVKLVPFAGPIPCHFGDGAVVGSEEVHQHSMTMLSHLAISRSPMTLLLALRERQGSNDSRVNWCKNTAVRCALCRAGVDQWLRSSELAEVWGTQHDDHTLPAMFKFVLHISLIGKSEDMSGRSVLII